MGTVAVPGILLFQIFKYPKYRVLRAKILRQLLLIPTQDSTIIRVESCEYLQVILQAQVSEGSLCCKFPMVRLQYFNQFEISKAFCSSYCTVFYFILEYENTTLIFCLHTELTDHVRLSFNLRDVRSSNFFSKTTMIS